MIEFQKVSFTYPESGDGGLHDVSLTIPDGQCVLLCGRSGCGKTTLTHLVNGLIPQFFPGELTGRVLLDGEDLAELPLYRISEKVGSVCIAEALGGRYDTPHGVSNAMVLSTVTEFNIPANTEKYAEVARHLGVDTTGMTEEEATYRCVDAMKSICADVKIPKMRDFEIIDPADFQALAEASFRNMSTPNNPRELSVQDFFDLLTKAYNA